MKIPVRALVLWVVRITVLSSLLYFPLKVLLQKYLPFLVPFVYIFILVFFVGLFSISVINFCTFKAIFEGEKLCIKKGFFIRRQEFLKLSMVVSVKSLTSPLGKLLKVYSAALIFEGNIYFLPPLFEENCNEILLKIKESGLKNERI